MPRTERRSRDSAAFRRNAASGRERRASRRNIHVRDDTLLVTIVEKRDKVYQKLSKLHS